MLAHWWLPKTFIPATVADWNLSSTELESGNAPGAFLQTWAQYWIKSTRFWGVPRNFGPQLAQAASYSFVLNCFHQGFSERVPRRSLASGTSRKSQSVVSRLSEGATEPLWPGWAPPPNPTHPDPKGQNWVQFRSRSGQEGIGVGRGELGLRVVLMQGRVAL